MQTQHEDLPGDLGLYGGYSASKSGGSVNFVSGGSRLSVSGHLNILSEIGTSTNSGNVLLGTGKSTKIAAGNGYAQTGNAVFGVSGSIIVSIGKGNNNLGGHIGIVAGSSAGLTGNGGFVAMRTGQSDNAFSGDSQIVSRNEAASGSSGTIALNSGVS